MYILWLRAHPENKYTELWDALYEMMQAHFGVESVFTFWRHTVLNLTNTVLRTVYHVPDEHIPQYHVYDTEMYEFQKKNKGLIVKKDDIKITSKSHTIDIKPYFVELQQDIGLHLWHKMFVMFGKDNASNTPGPLHTQKIKVISEVIDILLWLSHLELKPPKGESAPPFIHSPEANRILDLFGEWLVEASGREDQSFAEGRYSAYVSFCKVMSQKCSQPIKKRYLAEFYRCIHLGLTTPGTPPKVIEAIMLHSHRLFSTGHPGVNLLIPDFVKAVEPIVCHSLLPRLHVLVA